MFWIPQSKTIDLDKIIDWQHKNNKNYYTHVDFMLMIVNDNIDLQLKLILTGELYIHICAW